MIAACKTDRGAHFSLNASIWKHKVKNGAAWQRNATRAPVTAHFFIPMGLYATTVYAISTVHHGFCLSSSGSNVAEESGLRPQCLARQQRPSTLRCDGHPYRPYHSVAARCCNQGWDFPSNCQLLNSKTCSRVAVQLPSFSSCDAHLNFGYHFGICSVYSYVFSLNCQESITVPIFCVLLCVEKWWEHSFHLIVQRLQIFPGTSPLLHIDPILLQL